MEKEKFATKKTPSEQIQRVPHPGNRPSIIQKNRKSINAQE
jgi:hypothetical protein